MFNKRLIYEDPLTISRRLSKMAPGEHAILIYNDINSLREICCSHSKESLQSRNNVMIILYHYETGTSIRIALREFDIDVGRFEENRSLVIRDADGLLFRPNIDGVMHYLKSLELLAINRGKNGIDIIIDMGSFKHFGKEQELLQCELEFNSISSGSRSSILCCYHEKDIKAFDPNIIENIHKFHLTSYIVKEEQ